MKITPAHDPNDFEVGNRHNLERIVVMNEDATMNKNAGIYEGLTREEAREKLVKDLDESGILIRIEKMVHSVGHSERTDAVVEPYLSKQWFVKMRPLADKVLENQKNKDKKVNFVPTRFEKVMNHWMEITYDWCISRQLWWGHRIPAWYKGDQVYVGMEEPKENGWVQDNDVLDTWFSSALWPFATLGWPDNTDDMKRYYPNDVLVTGYDIIPFWVNRMTFQALKFTDKRPFEDCLIHGLIRDKQGRKMSKSLGNGVDPMDVIDEYGCDSLRLFLTTNSAPGMDLRFDEEKVKSTWNFINKLWNASRFVLMKVSDLKELSFNNLEDKDKWILSKYNKTIKEVSKYMNKYEFHNAYANLYSFIWDDFCDWYIEFAKINSNNTTKSILIKVLTGIIKMLHPFIPFVTEEIYQVLPFKNSDSIMETEYPKYDKSLNYDITDFEKIIEDIIKIRNFKAENNITNKDELTICKLPDENIYKGILKLNNIVSEKEGLIYESNLSKIIFYAEKKDDSKSILKEIEMLENSILRREKLLSNENYINRAPKDIVENEKIKLSEEKERLNILKKS